MKKSTLTSFLRLCGALALGVTSAACSGGPGNSQTAAVASAPVVRADTPGARMAPPASAAAPTPKLLQQIHAEIGDAPCNTAAQCHTVAIGHKACGGPESYMAWSSGHSDGAKLSSLAAAYAAERSKQDAAAGRISTCSVTIDPGASCNAGHCVTGAGDAGAPAVR